MQHKNRAIKVLFIDGEESDRQRYISGLQACASDYALHQATGGYTGLRRYKNETFDCVVQELELPDRSGFEVLMHLIPSPQQPAIPVIVLTQLTGKALRDLALKNGARACLVKSDTRPEDLHRAIRQALAPVHSHKIPPVSRSSLHIAS
ncbi:response regulator [Nitrospira sp. KM1]|uniref:response regulator n=1 Tax=Nitrospira sp. KM1 TaxID=1936990 RepID=UPI0013A7AC59|nr:response regulator [Nitrospira sp. KM1]BCA56040.1 response regulator [Nitrospira sp. KM1]